MEINPGENIENFTLLKILSIFGVNNIVWEAFLTGTNLKVYLTLRDKQIIKIIFIKNQSIQIDEDEYTLSDYIGIGSYGFVNTVEAVNKKKYAVKIFSDAREGEKEYEIYQKIGYCKNVLPIITGIYFGDRNQYLILMKKMVCDIYKKSFSIDKILQIIKNILTALTVIHDKNIVHGDIKTSNILLDEIGYAYICDFSNAYNKGEIVVEIGTIWFRSPEYCDSFNCDINGFAIDFPCDIWALGVSFLTMINNGNIPKFFCCNNQTLLLSRIGKQYLVDDEIERCFEKYKGSTEYEYITEIAKKMLTVESEKRITAKDALNFFFLDLESEISI